MSNENRRWRRRLFLWLESKAESLTAKTQSRKERKENIIKELLVVGENTNKGGKGVFLCD